MQHHLCACTRCTLTGEACALSFQFAQQIAHAIATANAMLHQSLDVSGTLHCDCPSSKESCSLAYRARSSEITVVGGADQRFNFDQLALPCEADDEDLGSSLDIDFDPAIGRAITITRSEQTHPLS